MHALLLCPLALATPADVAREALHPHLADLGADADWDWRPRVVYHGGVTTVRFDRHLGGVVVDGDFLAVHFDSEGAPVHITGRGTPGARLPTGRIRSADELAAALPGLRPAPGARPHLDRDGRVVLPLRGSGRAVLVDAVTGDVVSDHSVRRHLDAPGTHYPVNALRGEPEEVVLTELWDGSRISGPRFELVDGREQPSGVDSSGSFRFDPSETGFLFSNTWAHLDGAARFAVEVLELDDPDALVDLDLPGFVMVGVRAGDEYPSLGLQWTADEACNAFVEAERIFPGTAWLMILGGGGDCPLGPTGDAAHDGTVIRHEYAHWLSAVTTATIAGPDAWGMGDLEEAYCDTISALSLGEAVIGGAFAPEAHVRDGAVLRKLPDDFDPDEVDRHVLGLIAFSQAWDLGEAVGRDVAATLVHQGRYPFQDLLDQGHGSVPDAYHAWLEAQLVADAVHFDGRYDVDVLEVGAAHGLAPISGSKGEAPTVVPRIDGDLATGATVTLTADLDDPDGDALRGLRFRFVGAPEGSTWTDHVARGALEFTPDADGRYGVEVVASDAGWLMSAPVVLWLDVPASAPVADDAREGCGCATTGSSAPWALLAAVGLGLRRRRGWRQGCVQPCVAGRARTGFITLRHVT